MSEILLCKATRDELIEELKRRESITHLQVSEDEGASLMSKTGKIAITGKAHVFVITENEKTSVKE